MSVNVYRTGDDRVAGETADLDAGVLALDLREWTNSGEAAVLYEQGALRNRG